MEIIIEIFGLTGTTITRDGVVNWVVKLRFFGRKFQEKVRNFVFYFFNTSGRLVDFINNYNWL